MPSCIFCDRFAGLGRGDGLERVVGIDPSERGKPVSYLHPRVRAVFYGAEGRDYVQKSRVTAERGVRIAPKSSGKIACVMHVSQASERAGWSVSCFFFFAFPAAGMNQRGLLTGYRTPVFRSLHLL